MTRKWTGGGIREMTTRDIVVTLNDYEQRVRTLEAERDAWRQENRKLALAVSRLTLDKAELEREMVALIGPDSDAPTPRDSATPPGNAALWDNWRAEVAAWDALGDEAAALIDAPSDAPAAQTPPGATNQHAQQED